VDPQPCSFLDCATEEGNCGVCDEECRPCACCPDETGYSCGGGCCCCLSGQEPIKSGETCFCVAAP
jgi:hypothetical protein